MQQGLLDAVFLGLLEQVCAEALWGELLPPGAGGVGFGGGEVWGCGVLSTGFAEVFRVLHIESLFELLTFDSGFDAGFFAA